MKKLITLALLLYSIAVQAQTVSGYNPLNVDSKCCVTGILSDDLKLLGERTPSGKWSNISDTTALLNNLYKREAKAYDIMGKEAYKYYELYYAMVAVVASLNTPKFYTEMAKYQTLLRKYNH